MQTQSKKYQLKSGFTVELRAPHLHEAQKLVDLKRSYIKNTSTIPMTLDEYPNDLDNEIAIIKKYNDSPNSILVVADYDGELIGNIDLTGSARSKMAHTAVIGMGIKEGWRNQGLGTLLIESVVNWAKEHSALELIWLDVYASNELGFNLYKNMGFEVCGVIKKYFKDANGYQDKIQMYQNI